MSSVVITGSTRGLGFGMAEAFLACGSKVAISGRSKQSVERASKILQDKYPAERIFAFPCDVRKPSLLTALWEETKTAFGQIDIWINNAGFSGPQEVIKDIRPAIVKEVVETNLLGVIYGSQVAVRGMMQQGKGQIFNMEGAGSDGRMHDGLILYGTSKYAVSYFTRGLIKETSGSPLKVGSLKPGMVITDFIRKQYEGRPEDWERAKRIFNIIADRVETVAPWMVEKMLNNTKHGAQISWATRRKMFLRFISSPLVKRDLFGDEETG